MSIFDGGRKYTSSEFPGISRGKGMGRISRSAGATSSLSKAKISDSIRNHRAVAASNSFIVGKSRYPRRRLLGNINQQTLARALTILAAAVVVGLGVMLIATAARSGGKQINDYSVIETVDGDVLTADDTGATVTIALGGSIKLQDEVISAAVTGDGYDFNNYLSELKSVMTADVSVVGLSGTIDGRTGISGYPSPNYPMQIVDSLANIGVNYTVNASELTMKNGYDAMAATINNLEGRGITALGVTTNSETGSSYCVRRVNSVSIGIAAYNCVSSDTLEDMLNEQNKAGFTGSQLAYCANQLDMETASDTIIADVEAMRNSGAKFVIICLNWCGAGTTSPTYEMRSLAQDMIDNGVDITVGYGSDQMQKITVKKYTDAEGASKNCYVFYSLGNLFSDNGANSDLAKQENMVINFTLERSAGSDEVSVAGAYYHPIYVNRDENYVSESTYLKYRAVPAARYVDAETLPEAFSTGPQWERCIQTFTDIRRKFQEEWNLSDYFVLGQVEKVDSVSDTSGGGDAHL